MCSLFSELEERFGNDDFYFRLAKKFLIFTNPNMWIPMYRDVDRERAKAKDHHIFGLAKWAYDEIFAKNAEQFVLFAGPSSSGKSENLEKFAVSLVNPRQFMFTKQVESAFVVLGSFCNAVTRECSNSSRSSTLVEMEFRNHTCNGFRFEIYQLESGRVLFQKDGERTFHIFYQMLKGMSKDERKKNMLSEDYHCNFGCFSDKSCVDVTNRNDLSDWVRLMNAFQSLGFYDYFRQDIIRVLCGILHFSNGDVELSRHLWGLDAKQEIDMNMVESIYYSLVLNIFRKISLVLEGGYLCERSIFLFDPGACPRVNARVNRLAMESFLVFPQEEYVRQNIEWDLLDFDLGEEEKRISPTIQLFNLKLLKSKNDFFSDLGVFALPSLEERLYALQKKPISVCYCIQPSSKRASRHFERHLVEKSLKELRVQDIKEMSERMYEKFELKKFFFKFGILFKRLGCHEKDYLKQLHAVLGPENNGWKLGGSEGLFVKNHVVQRLDREQERVKAECIITVQQGARGYLGRLYYRNIGYQETAVRILVRNLKSWKSLLEWKWLKLFQSCRMTCCGGIDLQYVLKELQDNCARLEKKKKFEKDSERPLLIYSWIYKRKLNPLFGILPRDIYILIGNMIYFSDVMKVEYSRKAELKMKVISCKNKCDELEKAVYEDVKSVRRLHEKEELLCDKIDVLLTARNRLFDSIDDKYWELEKAELKISMFEREGKALEQELQEIEEREQTVYIENILLAELLIEKRIEAIKRTLEEIETENLRISRTISEF